MIRALVLDFDGLILDTETALIDAYGDVHAAHGRPFDRPTFAASVGQAEYNFDPWRAFGRAANRVALEEERRRFNRERELRQPLLPGVATLLEDARAAGLKVGLASNSERPHIDRLFAHLKLRPYFDFIACREDAPSPKPEPDLYRLVLQDFGLRGHEAIAFEDSHTGSLAAKRAGLWVVAVPNPSTGHHDFGHVDLKVASLVECPLAGLMARFGGTGQG